MALALSQAGRKGLGVRVTVAHTTPRLLDRKRIALELGISHAGAETIMRHCAKIRIGRRVYIERDELERFLTDQRFDLTARRAASR